VTATILELPGLFVSVDWLLEHIDDPSLVLLDATPTEFAAESSGILPGARHIQLSELSDPSTGFNYTIAAPEKLAAGFAATGIGDDSTVVTYDHGRGSWAALIRWRLRAVGFERAAILDGGPRRWAALGHPYVDSYASPPQTPATLTLHAHPEFHADVKKVEAATTENLQLLASVSSAIFDGTESAVGRVGHIPGSSNVPQADFVDADGLLLPHEALKARFAAAGIDASKPTIVYCNAGITAALGAAVLNELSNENVSVFDGGLQEWHSEPQRPTEFGDPQSAAVAS
jgi:thiosulfate/3-mercaptopyruvate sulfurtransferase